MIFPGRSQAKHFVNFAKIDVEKISSYILSLKPEDAIKYLKEKGFAVTWSWKEQLTLNHSQVFTVAKAMKMDVLQDIRGMLDKSLDEGLDFRQFKRELKPMLQKKGWWGYKVVDGKKVALGTTRRLETIYQANMQSSYMAGRWKAQEENSANRPWLQYINRSPKSDICKSLAGQIRRIDDPFWNTRYPPNHWRCKSRVGAFTDEQAKERGIPTKINTQASKPFRNNPGKDKWLPKKKDYSSDIWKTAQPITPKG